MSAPDPHEVTKLLKGSRPEQRESQERLLEIVYGELRGMANKVLGPSDGLTLQPTALVHEAWMKLAAHMDGLEGREHFFAVGAKAMRQIVADHARDRRRLKRGGGAARVTLGEGSAHAEDPGFDLVALDDTLRRLESLHERQARVVELRFLGGLTIEETAATLGISRHTVEDDWSMARAWLRRELGRA